MVTNFVSVSESIIATSIFLVQVITIADNSTQEVEFYSTSTTIIKQFHKHDINVIIVDFTANVRERRDGEFIGPYVMGITNERENRLNIKSQSSS